MSDLRKLEFERKAARIRWYLSAQSNDSTYRTQQAYEDFIRADNAWRDAKAASYDAELRTWKDLVEGIK